MTPLVTSLSMSKTFASSDPTETLCMDRNVVVAVSSSSSSSSFVNETVNNNDATITTTTTLSLERKETIIANPGFHWDVRDKSEPHAIRRKTILTAHPTVKELFGIDPMTKYKVCLGIVIQMLSLHLLQDASWYTWIFCCYTLSGSINHSMTLAMHELSHNLGGRGLLANKVLLLLANLSMGIPSAIAFKRYHAEHHKYMGEHNVDVDVPTYEEGVFFSDGRHSSLRKMLFMVLQPLFYSIRPLVVDPRRPCLWEYINMTTSVLFDLSVLYMFGPAGVVYLIAGTLLGMGIHPAAGHFIAEHYVMNTGQETYSYYGPWNWISYNCGYHVEHHDLPRVPCRNLPTVRDVAPEFYDALPSYHSWVKVLYDYITDPHLSPFSRVQRVTATHEEIRALRLRGGLVKCDKFL